MSGGSFSIGKAERLSYYESNGSSISKVEEEQEGDLFSWGRDNQSYQVDSGRRGGDETAYRKLQETFARWAKNPSTAKTEVEELIKELNDGGSVDMWLREMFTHDKSWKPFGKTISSPQDAFAAVSSMRNPFIESIRVLVLDKSDKVVHSEILTVGSISISIAEPRDFLRVLAAANSDGSNHNRLVIAHNHPSGDPSPSRADVSITKRLREALDHVDAELVDHIITNGTKGYSFTSQNKFDVKSSEDVEWSVAERTESETINDQFKAGQLLPKVIHRPLTLKVIFTAPDIVHPLISTALVD